MTWRELANGVEAGESRALARAITLVESTRADHRNDAAELLDALLPRTGDATRIGISGAPGVGKSTFIEALGLHLVDAGQRVAVLAVDPSSTRSGGSILGDKTRMDELARRDGVYIRPSPSRGALGGVTRRTREAILICEAAGFDAVIVETVGVGQSETEVADMVDVFALLVSPGAGDDLQGIKRGVTELADIVVITKADGQLLPAAQQAAADYRQALHLIRRRHAGWDVPVTLCSAVDGTGVDEVWDAAVQLRAMLAASGELHEARGRQAVAWLWAEVTQSLVDALRADHSISGDLDDIERAVAGGSLSPVSGARTLLELSRKTIGSASE